MDNKLGCDIFWESVVQDVRAGRKAVKVEKQGRVFTRRYCLHRAWGNVDLSAREVEVILGIMRGLDPQAIARRLELSPYTVAFYFRNIKRKLHVQSRMGLIDEVVRSGFLFEIDLGKNI
ncbi:MAG: helix-turn-helix transcriptional regulator [Gammaproteobacteria bacterium]|nr:helix-turn-helix transcriptional regulator [Gammaproteobacteria bacterium]